MHPLTAVAPYALPVGGAAFVVATIVQLTKWIITSREKLTDQAQIRAVRTYVYAVSVVVVAAYQYFAYHLNNRTDVADVFSSSLIVAAVAVATYHVLTSDSIPTIPLAAAEHIVPEPVAITQPEPATPPAA